jgi:hypothetical protein
VAPAASATSSCRRTWLRYALLPGFQRASPLV